MSTEYTTPTRYGLDEIKNAVLGGFDFVKEFESACNITWEKEEPNGGGWQRCYATRGESKASAAFNVQTGQYKDSGRPDEEAISFFDLMSREQMMGGFWPALEHYARKAQIPSDMILAIGALQRADRDSRKPFACNPPAGRKSFDSLEFHAWTDDYTTLLAKWCEKKKGLKPHAFIAAGGRVATHGGRLVFCIPMFDPTGAVTGWTMWTADGEGFPQFTKDGAPDKPLKMKRVGGSVSGWIGKRGLDLLRKNPRAKVVKLEGEPDVIAMESVLTAEEAEDLAVLTNACGAAEVLGPEFLKLLEGRTVYVIGDADDAGERGALKWCERLVSPIAPKKESKPGVPVVESKGAAEVFNLVLPPEKKPKDGPDVRDMIIAGWTWPRFAALVETAAVFRPPAPRAAVIEGPRNPQRLARLFVEPPRGQLVRMHKRWIQYVDNRYEKLEEEWLESDVERFIKATFDREYLAGPSIPGQVVEECTEPLMRNVMRSLRNMHAVMPRGELPFWIDGSRQVRAMGTIAFRNGILDLNRLFDREPDAFVPPTSNFLTMNSLDHDFDPKASCPRWLAFLDQNLEGSKGDKAEKILLLQQWFGYCLKQGVNQCAFLMLVGNGANGKSVILTVLRAMLAERNCCSVPIRKFGERFSLHQTLSKFANICDETDIGEGGINEEMLKAAAGGSPIDVEKKYADPFSARSPAKLIVCANSFPHISDKTNGVWRRASVLCLEFVCPPEKQDNDLGLMATWADELPGITNWALGGLASLIGSGKEGGKTGKYQFVVPASSKDFLSGARRDASPARRFIEDSLIYRPGMRASAAEVYQAYVDWCKDHGHTNRMNDSNFGKEVHNVLGIASKQVKVLGENRRWYIDHTVVAEGESGWGERCQVDDGE